MYPLVRLAGVKVACYTHYPTISTDMLLRVFKQKKMYNNSGAASSRLGSIAKLVYYYVFACFYGMSGGCANVSLFIRSFSCHNYPSHATIIRFGNGLTYNSFQDLVRACQRIWCVASKSLLIPAIAPQDLSCLIALTQQRRWRIQSNLESHPKLVAYPSWALDCHINSQDSGRWSWSTAAGLGGTSSSCGGSWRTLNAYTPPATLKCCRPYPCIAGSKGFTLSLWPNFDQRRITPYS